MTEVVERRRRQQPVGVERRKTPTPLHFRRIELKYVVPRRQVPELVERLSPYVELDPFLAASGNESYPVTSLYFDTFELQSLFEKEAGWLSRRRIRLRTYADRFTAGGTTFFEIKRRHDFLTSKDRLPLAFPNPDDELVRHGTLRHLLSLARADASSPAYNEAMVLNSWYNLQPTSLVSYDRIAYVSRFDPDLRITIDRELRGVWRPMRLAGCQPYRRCGIDPVLPRMLNYGAHQSRGPAPISANANVVLELKFTHGIPAWLHRVITAMELARSAYSKYAFVVRSLRPQLFEAYED